jgi:hypothetical protein
MRTAVLELEQFLGIYSHSEMNLRHHIPDTSKMTYSEIGLVTKNTQLEMLITIASHLFALTDQ